jgi:hypothetical protein
MRATSRNTVPIPSATEILDNPALAALTVLDVALHVAAIAVAVEHPDLQLLDSQRWPREPPPASLAFAAVMLEKIDSLGAVLERYRAALAAEDARSLRDDPF